MSQKTGADLDVLLPFAVALCMAAGSFVAYVAASPTLLTEGSGGDMAGAAGALTMIVSGGCGLFASLVALAVARARGRGRPQRMAFRCALAAMAGAGVGLAGTSRSEALEWLTWFCLLGAPALLTWFWRTPVASSSTGAAPAPADAPPASGDGGPDPA
jgi:hypothetical protein